MPISCSPFIYMNNIFTYIYYDIARYLSYHATFLPKIDRKVLELHGNGYTIQRISNYLRDNFKYPLNKKGRKGKPYSVFYVHTKLKYLKLLITIYAKTDCLETVKKSWQSIDVDNGFRFCENRNPPV